MPREVTDDTTPQQEVETSFSSVRVPTRIVSDDVISDDLEREEPRATVDRDHYVQILWDANPHLHQILSRAESLEQARAEVFTYLEHLERDLFSVENPYHVLEKATVRDCIRVFKSIIGPINERRTDFSALESLWRLASDRPSPECEVAVGFLMEFIHLFRGMAGHSNIYREQEEVRKGIPDFLRLQGRPAAELRSVLLDEMGESVRKYFKRYPSGLDPEVIRWRRQNRERILRYFGASEEDWNDYRWHLKHVITEAKAIFDLVDLLPERQAALKKATQERLPFGITPYYLSLMDRNPSIGYDHAVRAQVLAPPEYVDELAKHTRDRRQRFDFMGEQDTSPVSCVTRRYPLVCILKPYNTCAQICVYCQRNWEINEVLAADAQASWDEIDHAIEWIADRPALGDVLITGGDPAVLSDQTLDRILGRIATIDHVYRIRLGTRMPVVIPFRITTGFCDLLSRYHEPGRREVAVVTHIEHPYEITPELRDAVQAIRSRGIGVYNQQVFTLENSRRFETAKLRRDLRLIGVDPYYTFNMKGKKETGSYMAPIARLLQERKEEARLLPGLDRTDEPVFNVPRLGKNHLRAFQDHRVVMILPNGSRVYQFHPWEKNITPMPPFHYVDTPVLDYLEKLAARGENVRDYRTIWYYY